MGNVRLADWVDRRQSSGRYTFTSGELPTLGAEQGPAVQAALRRLKKKGRIASPHRGFYVTVPLEHQVAGAPPPSWYIDDLMRFLQRPYYVGILTAAELHGAAHQRPQEFQVVTDRPIRERIVGRARLRFLQRKDVNAAEVERRKTETGYITVSTAEQTALDLLRYVHAAGHLSNVVTVLAELAERIDAARLAEAARHAERSDAQRLGYLLTSLGHRGLTAKMRECLDSPLIRVPLRRGGGRRAELLDDEWAVYVNEELASSA